jgi:hypothetical protein
MKIDRALNELNDLYERNGYKPILAPEALAGTNWANDQQSPRYFETTLATGQVLRAHFRTAAWTLGVRDHAAVSFLLDGDPFPWESETGKIEGRTVRREIEALITVLTPLAREIVAQDKTQRRADRAAAEAQAKQTEIDQQAALLRADKLDLKN